MENAVQRIISERKSVAASNVGEDDNKLFSLLVGDGMSLYFEARFRDGTRLALDYSNLQWFMYDPEQATLELDFSGVMLRVSGRGLNGKLYDGILFRRVAWIKEADSEFQDNPETDVYIEKIEVDAGNSQEEA